MPSLNLMEGGRKIDFLKMADDCNCHIEPFLPDYSGKPFFIFRGKLRKHLYLPRITLNSFTGEKVVAPGWIHLLQVLLKMSNIEMGSICFHSSMERIQDYTKLAVYCVCIHELFEVHFEGEKEEGEEEEKVIATKKKVGSQ